MLSKNKGKNRQGLQEPLSESEDNRSSFVLLPAEQKLHMRALQMCKDFGVMSLKSQQKIYLYTREVAIVAMQYRGVPNLIEEDEGFDIHFMDALQDAIQVQPGSQRATLPPLPLKSPIKNKLHQMLKADAQLPAATGVGFLKQSQTLHTVINHNNRASPQRVEEVKTDSVNIIIPLGAKQLSEIPLITEDPNVAGAVAKLTAPRELGETFQMYEQRHVAAEQWHGIPTPVFVGQAGECSKHQTEHLAPPELHLDIKSKEVTTSGIMMNKKLNRVPMAEKLEDRVAYQ